MARSDLLLSLVKAGRTGDRELLRKTVDALIAEERSKRHDVLANRLAEEIAKNGTHATGNANGAANLFGSPVQDLFYEKVPHRTLDDLILGENVRTICQELAAEHHRRDLLRNYGLEPRHRILLVGPPGNGKTSLAEAIAHALMVPLIVVRYEGLIGSYLGETASRLRKLFDYVRTRSCVFFFDEFDTLGKERGDVHETGEIKRVVSSLLLQVDDLPSHVVLVTATNHPELLDRAAWRRFQIKLQLDAPKAAEIQAYFERFRKPGDFDFGVTSKTLASKLAGASYADLEGFVDDVTRKYVLALPDADVKRIVSDRLKQWQQIRPNSKES